MASDRRPAGQRDQAAGDDPVPVTTAALSRREREVLHHFSNGLTYLQTAHRMGIATSTVDTYLRRIRAKAGVASGAELIRLALALEAHDTMLRARR